MMTEQEIANLRRVAATAIRELGAARVDFAMLMEERNALLARCQELEAQIDKKAAGPQLVEAHAETAAE